MRMHYERDENGEYTGVTVCDIDGVKGYPFCYPDKFEELRFIHVEEGEMAYTVRYGDEFNKKLGRTIAEGRANKLKNELDIETPESEILVELYSPRMLSKIDAYRKRNPYKFVDTV